MTFKTVEKDFPRRLNNQVCPDCQAVIPVIRGYRVWCDECNWNISSINLEYKPSLIEKWFIRISEKSGRKLFEEMIKGNNKQLFFNFKIAFAYLLVIIVYLLLLVIMGAGIWIMIFVFPTAHWFGVFVGVFYYVILWILVRPQSHPEGTTLPISRNDYPVLYNFIDRISQAFGSSAPEEVACDISFNACVYMKGWKQNKKLILGIPLVSVLDPGEFVALLGHELAHIKHNDPSRRFLIIFALQFLETLYNIVHPYNPPMTSGNGSLRIFIIHILTFPISAILWIMGYLIANLLWYDKQKCEYLADCCSAQVAGKESSLALVRKTHLVEIFQTNIKNAYIDKNQKSKNFFHDVKILFDQVPERELERIRRIEEKIGHGIESSHPGFVFRSKVLQIQDSNRENIIFSSSEMEELWQELSPLILAVQKEIFGMDDILFRETFHVNW